MSFSSRGKWDILKKRGDILKKRGDILKKRGDIFLPASHLSSSLEKTAKIVAHLQRKMVHLGEKRGILRAKGI